MSIHEQCKSADYPKITSLCLKISIQVHVNRISTCLMILGFKYIQVNVLSQDTMVAMGDGLESSPLSGYSSWPESSWYQEHSTP